MSFYQELPYPVFVGTGAVLTSGGTETLKPGQLGIFDATTYQALAAGESISLHPSILIAQGSWHTVDALSKFIGGLKQSTKTQSFAVKNVQEFHRSAPVPLTQDTVQLGWDTVNATNSLSFEAGKSYFFKVNVSGEDVFRTYSRPLYRFIELRTECPSDTTGCATTCTDPVDPTYYAGVLANLINNDVELKYFVKAEPVVSNYSASSLTYRAYHLDICDNGDVVALAAVQTSYSTKTVTRVARAGSTSTYELVDLIANGAPANFTPTGSILQAVCGVCPAGYGSVGSQDYYIARRPIAGSENFASSTASFIATVLSDYSGVASTAVFLGQDGAVALVQFRVVGGTTVTAVKDDVVAFSHNAPALCTPPAGSAVAWTTFKDYYKPVQYLYSTIDKPCGGSNRLTDIQAFYTGDPYIVSGSIVVLASSTCSDTYRLQQISNDPLTDDCLSPAGTGANYGQIQSYNGFSWSNVPPTGVVAHPYPGSPVYAGVRITGAYADTKFGNCSFEPTDYFSQRPVRITVSQVTSDGQPCTTGVQPLKTSYGTVATQTGEWLIRQYLKYISLEAYSAWSNDPRIRDIYDQRYLEFIDRTALYNVYYIVYNQERFGANWNTMQPNDKFETIVAFKQGVDTTNFENLFGGVFSQAGIYLKERSI